MERQLILFDFDETIVSNSGDTDIIKPVLDDFVEYSSYPSNDVYILTARYRRVPVVRFFRNLGISNVEVVAVGEINPLAKSSFVANKLSEKNYKAVRVYEDKIDNISAIAKVATSMGAEFSYMLVRKRKPEDALRQFVDYTLDQESKLAKSPGAGIVVVRKFDNEWKVLGLRLGSEFDLPKGKTDPGEDAFQTAVRETREEASITDLDFKWGKKSTSIKHLTFFIAQTSQDPVIAKNQESGIFEHDEAVWMDFKDLKSKVYGYLVPIVNWAESIVIK